MKRKNYLYQPGDRILVEEEGKEIPYVVIESYPINPPVIDEKDSIVSLGGKDYELKIRKIEDDEIKNISTQDFKVKKSSIKHIE